ncbi:hypothetical protein [Sphingopyxis macrogoltabida]|uniref:hypothetical protein n=1 Tax=Sphingopyxis macrogoltabida TaxID=33050 RepID=UPI0006ED2A25|nr:hypothetical protein [Sphingopyxis macrogoltabida]ALJ14421.1 hypothetical protein LH19_16240 [Sphingopyxis macrogoltabida]
MQWRLAILLPAIMTVQACERQRPVVSEELVRELKDELPGITEQCLNRLRYGGIDAMPTRADQCFEMGPKKLWKGLWRNDFEGSRFCASPAESCSSDTSGERIWLSDPDNILRVKTGDEALYRIEFWGRRTLKAGAHGHLGGSDHDLIVDEVISLARMVPESPGDDS